MRLMETIDFFFFQSAAEVIFFKYILVNIVKFFFMWKLKNYIPFHPEQNISVSGAQEYPVS